MPTATPAAPAVATPVATPAAAAASAPAVAPTRSAAPAPTAPRPANGVSRPAPVAPAAPTSSGTPAEPVAVATVPQHATAPWTEAPRPVARAEDPRSWATVESVRAVRTGGDANGLGAVAGGMLDRQVEQRVRGDVRPEAVVRLDDGGTRTFVREAAWSVQPGERVRVIDGRLVDAAAAAPATRQVRYGAPSGG